MCCCWPLHENPPSRVTSGRKGEIKSLCLFLSWYGGDLGSLHTCPMGLGQGAWRARSSAQGTRDVPSDGTWYMLFPIREGIWGSCWDFGLFPGSEPVPK